MAVMVGTPNVDGTVKTAHGQLVVMVGDVGGKIGGNAVGAYQNFVFGFLFAVGVFVPSCGLQRRTWKHTGRCGT